MNDVLLNKITAIRRCIWRIHEEFGDENEFRENITKQDSVILNLQRACEAAIDIANYLILVRHLEMSQGRRDRFGLLAANALIPSELPERLQKTVELRNIAVNDTQTLNTDLVVHVIRHRLSDLERLIQAVALAISK